MAKTGYTTYWAPIDKTDLVTLKAQHNRCFPGNGLIIVEGFAKVAVLDGETIPTDSISVEDMQVILEARAEQNAPGG